MTRKTEKRVRTKYVKTTCGICKKKVDQYLIITPAAALLRVDVAVVEAGKTEVVCKRDLARLHI
jgi:hypothetical protein